MGTINQVNYYYYYNSNCDSFRFRVSHQVCLLGTYRGERGAGGIGEGPLLVCGGWFEPGGVGLKVFHGKFSCPILCCAHRIT